MGLEKAIANANLGSRRRCLMCGKFGHESIACVPLEKRECDEPIQVDSLPIADKIVGHLGTD